MKNLFNFNKYIEFWSKNKKIVIILTLLLGIPWSFFMALTTSNIKFVFDFICILPFGLLFGFLCGILFPIYMQTITGEYIIPYIYARVFRITLHKYEESVEYYKIALDILKNSKPKGQKKKMKKSYLLGTYNDLAICYSKLGNKELAEKYIKKAVRYLSNKKKQKYLDKMYKKYINEKPKMSEKKKKTIIISIIILIFILGILANILSGYIDSQSNDNAKYVKVAETDDVKKADEIQTLITNMSYMPTLREVDGVKTIISIKGCSMKNRALATIMIASSPYFDTNIGFSNHIFGIGKEKPERKELNRTLQTIPGVLSVLVELNFPENMFLESNNKEKVSARINVFTSNDFEQKRIEKTVKNVLLGTVSGLNEENISIYFDMLENPNKKLIQRHQERLEWFTKIYNNKTNLQ